MCGKLVDSSKQGSDIPFTILKEFSKRAGKSGSTKSHWEVLAIVWEDVITALTVVGVVMGEKRTEAESTE